MSEHATKFSIVESPAQGTSDRELSRDHLRDALGAYAPHSRLERTPKGRKVLDAAADVTAALVSAMSERKATDVRKGRPGRTATEWAELVGYASGEDEKKWAFRSPGEIRKMKCGEHVATLTDVAVLKALDPDAFVEFVADLAQSAGGRFELHAGARRPLAQVIAKLGTCTAELNSAFLLAQSPESAGGTAITAAEIEEFRAFLATQQRLIADAAATIAALEGQQK